MVLRGAIDAFLAAFGSYRSRGEKVILRHLGVTELDPSPDAWFSQRAYLSAMKELQEQFGTAFLRKIGSLLFDNSPAAPEIDTIPAAMAIVQHLYATTHRNGEGKNGSYVWMQTGERSGAMRCDAPYPCALDIGLLESLAGRCTPKGTVRHQDGPCRHKGDDECTYVVEW
jgi:hypothetical protein